MLYMQVLSLFVLMLNIFCSDDKQKALDLSEKQKCEKARELEKLKLQDSQKSSGNDGNKVDDTNPRRGSTSSRKSNE